MQTAQLASEQLAPPGGSPTEVVPEPDLRERDFGSFELTSDINYPTVWAQDTEDIDSKPTPDGVQHSQDYLCVCVHGKSMAS